MLASALCMAAAIYFEARSEPVSGQIAVGHVIQNRVEHSLFPNDVCSVVHEPGQFSPNIRRNVKVKEKEAYLTALEISFMLLITNNEDPTDGATHFYSGPRPTWARKFPRTAVIGDHNFHKQKDPDNG